MCGVYPARLKKGEEEMGGVVLSIQYGTKTRFLALSMIKKDIYSNYCYNRSGSITMPILSMFYGIIIRMYYADNKQHHVPHIHAEYGNNKAVFSIEDGRLLAGKFPKNKTRLVLA